MMNNDITWSAIICAAILGVFLAWMGLNAIEKAAFDVINTIEID